MSTQRTSLAFFPSPVGWAVMLPYVLAVAAGLALWYGVSLRYHITTFPSPQETLLEAFRELESGEMLAQAWISVSRILAGFVIASVIAVPIGLAMGVNDFVRRMFEPVTEFFRFIPAISMIVFAIIWFGIGEASKVFLVVFNTVFIVIINTEAGAKSVGKNAVRAAQMMGANRRQVFTRVTVPSAVPYIVTGMRIAMGRSFTTIVAAEMLGASSGLGFMIFSAREFMRMDTVLVGIVVLGLLGLTIDVLFRLLVKYVGKNYVGNLVG
jgi:ABC-type nitrate/sulfonate/bicarbonate transport system permease component